MKNRWISPMTFASIGSAAPDLAIVLDTETTGLLASEDDIIQFAAVDYDGSVLLNKFYGSEKAAWPEAEAVNHISPASVAHLAPLKRNPLAAQELEALLSEAGAVAGYNLPFDLGFLRAAGVRIPDRILFCDAMIYTQSLRSMCDCCEIQPEGFHDSVNDSLSALGVIKAVQRRAAQILADREDRRCQTSRRRSF